jgi:hypothetical protein
MENKAGINCSSFFFFFFKEQQRWKRERTMEDVTKVTYHTVPTTQNEGHNEFEERERSTRSRHLAQKEFRTPTFER